MVRLPQDQTLGVIFSRPKKLTRCTGFWSELIDNLSQLEDFEGAKCTQTIMRILVTSPTKLNPPQ